MPGGEPQTSEQTAEPLHHLGGALRVMLVAVVVALAVGVPVAARSAPPVLSPVAISVLDPPHPVLAADNHNHLVYELQLVNMGGNAVTVDSVQPRADGRPLGARLDGKRLTSSFLSERGPTIAPGIAAVLLMDVTFARSEPTPQRLAHHLRFTIAGGDPAHLSFTGVRTPVRGARATEIAPPLRDSRWLDGDGCCGVTAHRGAILPIDGTIHISQRFAVDLTQLDRHNRLFSGARDELSSYHYYGAPVHAVANGKVVRSENGLPDQVPDPGGPPPVATIQGADGDYVVQRLSDRRFALYAHLKPGSLRVGNGDRVRQGQVIGRLGNSGNSNLPHLHFQVMNSASPLESNGVPYTFTSFRGQGKVIDKMPLLNGDPAPIDRAALAGHHRHQLPKNDQLLDLG